MERRSAPQIIKINISAALLILLGGIFVAAASGQTTPTIEATPTPEEQELLRARRANEDAQAEYYREQTNKLRQPPPPGKSFGQSVADNPASVIGVVGTILGAIIVASVSLLTLFFNSRNAIKAQRDIQFYEAMKRMGDKDSPTIRASAAGLLALMAQVEWWEVSLVRKRPFLELVRSQPYFATALDQLLRGHLLEDNLVGVRSIEDALRQLIPHDLKAVIHRLYEANLSFQDELVSLLAEFFVLNGCQEPPNLDGAWDSVELWEQLSSAAGYEGHVLRNLALHNTSFMNRFDIYRRIIEAQNSGDRGQLLHALNERIRVVSGRLRANVAVFCAALGNFQPNDAPPPEHGASNSISFERSFLVGGEIGPEANLSNINFTNSNFDGLRLIKVNLADSCFSGAALNVRMEGGSLRNSDLSRAQLEEAWLSGVDMTDAHLGGANIRYSISGNWWKANFYTSYSGAIDEKLLESLFKQGGRDVPENLNWVHASVRSFLESRRAKGEPAQSS